MVARADYNRLVCVAYRTHLVNNVPRSTAHLFVKSTGYYKQKRRVVRRKSAVCSSKIVVVG